MGILQFSYGQSYEQILSEYENKPQNDETALPYIAKFIQKAKKGRDPEKLVQGYKDAIFFSASKEKKLAFADSAVTVAVKSEKIDLQVNAYMGKGIVYYSNYKKYKPALDEYLKAYHLSTKSNNHYLHHKVEYHLGVVKSYLGYYTEALDHFNSCAKYFRSKITSNTKYPNELYNNTKGYLNSLDQAANCYIRLGKFGDADTLLEQGLKFVGNSNDFLIEKSYFTKNKGIISFEEKQYQNSLKYLGSALPAILKKKDFTSESVIYYYMAKSNMQLGNDVEALIFFQKVDSVFQQNHFVLPELRENYEFLIRYHHQKNNKEAELRYTKALLKADSIINKDFSYLSSRIHKEYDIHDLLKSKERLEKSNRSSIGAIALLMVCLCALFFFVLKYSTGGWL